jgi:SAM-dependent methyltransferase
MEGMEYFYELFEALPRGGPGDHESTRQAFNFISELPPQPLILDIGCGPGMQTIELAKLSDGKIIALDNHLPFLNKLKKTAREEGLLNHIVFKNVSMLEMDFENEIFDLIWSEGALYFMGFQNGLKKCYQLLKDNGFLAVTELVFLLPNPPVNVIKYFEKGYADMKDISGNVQIILNENFKLIENFALPKSAWLDSYYQPMEKELLRLKKKYQANQCALGIFREMEVEIDFYKKYSDFYGYEFFIMQKNC